MTTWACSKSEAYGHPGSKGSSKHIFVQFHCKKLSKMRINNIMTFSRYFLIKHTRGNCGWTKAWLVFKPKSKIVVHWVLYWSYQLLLFGSFSCKKNACTVFPVNPQNPTSVMLLNCDGIQDNEQRIVDSVTFSLQLAHTNVYPGRRTCKKKKRQISTNCFRVASECLR